jgi:trimeric autotransporter adhesin
MKSMGSFALSALAGALLCAPALVAQQAVTPAVRIVSAIDEGKQITLQRTVHPLANAQNDRGAVPDNMQLQRMHLVLKRSPDQEKALRQFIADANAANSPSYHKWLTPDEFGKKFGPSDQDIAAVENWLQGHGFSITKVNPGKQTIEISGTVAQLRSAFHTQIHKYEVNGETRFANTSDPSVPAALAPVVGGFTSLNNFPLKNYTKKLGTASYNPATGKAKPSWTIGGGEFNYEDYNFPLTPADYAVQYNLNSLYNNAVDSAINNATGPIDGTGQTIAIINEANINIYLVNRFRTLFGLPANPPQVIIDGNDPGIDGINNPYGPNDASVEAYLDVEWAGAVAPKATIDLVIAGDTELSNGLWLAAEHAVYGNVAPILSVSFGNCEEAFGYVNEFISSLWEQAAAQGQTVLVSSGDSGAAGCDSPDSSYSWYGQAVNGLASTPYNVAVGGTDFYYSNYNNDAINDQLASYWNTTASNTTPTASIKGTIPEQPWNNSQYGFNLFSYYDSYGETTIVGAGGGASNAAVCDYYYDFDGTCLGNLYGYDKPSYQWSVTPEDEVRDLPDVSLFAANGWNNSYYPICATDGDCTQVNNGYTQIFGVGGTSASTPAFAGIMALVNQSMASSDNPDGRQGQANYILYPLFSQFQSGETPPYNDVTVGSISVPCDYEVGWYVAPNCVEDENALVSWLGKLADTESGTPYYDAGTGYDLATGLGTINGYNLVTNWGKVELSTSATTLTLTCDSDPCPSTLRLNTPVTFSGTVTGSMPIGTVALMTDSTEPMQAGQTSTTLSDGSYSMEYPALPGGTYNIWAHYSGDSNNGPSDSDKVLVTVGTATSFTDFNVIAYGGSYYSAGTNLGEVSYGTSLQLEAQVGVDSDADWFPIPTGTVIFADNGATIDTATLNAIGEAAYNPAFAVGSHSVTASYSGDQSYSNSNTTDKPTTFTVVKNGPSIDVNVSADYQEVLLGTGQPSVLTFTLMNSAQDYNDLVRSNEQPRMWVPAAAPTGNITLSSSSLLNGASATLVPGVDPYSGAAAGIATFTIPASTASGDYEITFNYNGDSNYTALSGKSDIPVWNVNCSQEGCLYSTTAATLSATSTSPASTITLSGTVTGQAGHGAPTGEVWAYSSGYWLGSVSLTQPLSGVVSTFSIQIGSQDLLWGANAITIQYDGDNIYFPSAAILSTITNSIGDFTVQPLSPIVVIPSNSTGAVTLNVTSMNRFAGTVSLTCAGSPSSSPLTCSAAGNATLTAAGSASNDLTITVPADTPNGTYHVLATGTSGNFIHTAQIEVIVSGTAAALIITPGAPASSSVSAGSSTTDTVTLGDVAGYSGIVTFTCTVSPSNLTSPPTCTLSPTQVTYTNGTPNPASLTATIHTTAPTTSELVYPKVNGWMGFGGGAVLAAFIFLWIPPRRRNWITMLGLLVLMIGLGSLTACGGGGGGGHTPVISGGTKAGTYTFTIKGAGNNVALTSQGTFTVTVN